MIDIITPTDKTGRAVGNLLDLFVTVFIDDIADPSISPNYFGDVMIDGRIMIRRLQIIDNVKEITFYLAPVGSPPRTIFADRASKTYKDLWEVW